MIKFWISGLFSLSAVLSLQAQPDPGRFSASATDTLAPAFLVPVFDPDGDQESEIGQQDVSSLLQASPDVFAQFAGFQFGQGRYRPRGYAARYQQVMINGLNMNDPETCFSAWSSWGGLNDVMRYPEAGFGNTACSYGFAGAAGYVHMSTLASEISKGTRLSYASGNRLFRHRLMLTHATGWLPGGWNIAASVSTRQGNEVYVPGTFFQSNSFFLSADKRLRKAHLLSLAAFYTPVQQGRASSGLLETYRLTGSNYYNPLWGYQAGKVRNSTVSSTSQPVLLLSHRYQPDDNTMLNTSLGFSAGKSGITGLNWNNAPNPRPDYYYYLPSYYLEMDHVMAGEQLTQQWHNDVNTRQVNWDRLIALNQGNLYSLPSEQGQTNTSETRARYIVEERVEQRRQLYFSSVYHKRADILFISAGVNGLLHNNRKYKQVNDLLGASYWLDYDQFAQNLGADPMLLQNNLEQPDKKMTEGQKIGYDYLIAVRQAEAWAQAECSFRKLDLYAGVSISGRSVWKESYAANGKFPDNSKGRTETMHFLNHGLKAGATYKLTGRQFISINGAWMTRAPETGKLFVSQTVRNDLIGGAVSESIFSGDLSYIVQYPTLKLRATGYSTQINDQVWLQRYWSDAYNTSINYFMTNVDERHQGLELGIEKTFRVSHQLQGALGYGQYYYTSRPIAQAWQDNTHAGLFSNRLVYFKNYRIGFTPQLAAGVGYRYNANKRWFAAIYLNYFDAIYVDPNPDRRTVAALETYSDKDMETVSRIVAQERLPGYALLNLSAGKQFRISKKYGLRLNLSVNNITNNRNRIISGYEQLRWDAENIQRFPAKYVFMTGATYLAIVSFSF